MPEEFLHISVFPSDLNASQESEKQFVLCALKECTLYLYNCLERSIELLFNGTTDYVDHVFWDFPLLPLSLAALAERPSSIWTWLLLQFLMRASVAPADVSIDTKPIHGTLQLSTPCRLQLPVPQCVGGMATYQCCQLLKLLDNDCPSRHSPQTQLD